MEKALKEQELALKQQELQIKGGEVTAKQADMAQQRAQDDRRLNLEAMALLSNNSSANRSHDLAQKAHQLNLISANATQGPDGQPVAGEAPEAKSAQVIMQGLQMLAETLKSDNQSMMQALTQIAAVVAAPRKSEIKVDAKGNKTAVSVPMLN
jgi:hypothetical protein